MVRGREEDLTTTTEYQVTGMICGHWEMAVRDDAAAAPQPAGY